MTADELFDRVLALMFSDDSEKSDMLKSFLADLNIHLLELFDKENGFRDEPLVEPPIITSLTDTIEYNRRILAFLPYGIAGTLLAENDPNIAAQYKNKYEEERTKCIVCRIKKAVNDCAV